MGDNLIQVTFYNKDNHIFGEYFNDINEFLNFINVDSLILEKCKSTSINNIERILSKIGKIHIYENIQKRHYRLVLDKKIKYVYGKLEDIQKKFPNHKIKQIQIIRI